MTVFSISAYNIKTAMTIYYTQYYLHDASVLPYVNFIAIGSSIIGIVAMPVLVKRFGKKHTAIFGFALAGTADGINFLLPSNTVIFTVLLALSFIGVAIPNGVTWAMVSDVIDYGQWRTRRRSEGITYSMFNFSRKIAQSIAGGLARFGLTLIGYVPNVVDQTPGTLLGIQGPPDALPVHRLLRRCRNPDLPLPAHRRSAGRDRQGDARVGPGRGRPWRGGRHRDRPDHRACRGLRPWPGLGRPSGRPGSPRPGRSEALMRTVCPKGLSTFPRRGRMIVVEAEQEASVSDAVTRGPRKNR